MGLLNSLKDAVHYVGGKLASGASWIGDKVSKVGKAIGGIADTVAGPASFVLGPEAGAAIKMVGGIAKTAGDLGSDAKKMADNYQSRNNPPPLTTPNNSSTNIGIPVTQAKTNDSVGSLGQQMPSMSDIKSGLSEGVKSMMPNFRFH